MGTDEVDYRDVELRMFQHVLADDMSPEQEQEIAALVGDQQQLGDSVAHSSHQALVTRLQIENQLVLDPETSLALHAELERRKAIYRALMIGYTVKEDKFDNIPKAQRVLPNPRNKKPQEPLTPEQERRLARIKKTLKKRK